VGGILTEQVLVGFLMVL